MIKARAVSCAAMVLGLAGCADQVTGPEAAAPRSPKAVKSVANAHVWDYGAIPNDGQDDAAAFQAAVNAGQVVFVPAGTYDFWNTVLLPSDTYIYGQATETVLRAVGPHWTGPDPRFGDRTPAIFFAFNEALNSPRSVVGVSVAHLSFVGGPGTNAFAFDARHADSVRFTDSWVTDLGMVRLDRTTNAQVLRSRGAGVSRHPFQGIIIEYGSRYVTVKHDTLSGYHNAVQWWGGAADPRKPESFTWERGVGNITVDSSRITDVGAGIWGGNGEYIDVTNNTVEICQDVCLDAEGSDHVRFIGNTARYAGQSVLASFFHSHNVTFENNTVAQDGCARGSIPVPSDFSPMFPWQGMFGLYSTYQDPGNITTTLRNNRFTYTRTCGGVGRVYKEVSKSMTMDNNTLTNTVVDMQPDNNNGDVTITNNKLSLSYNAGMPAIDVGSNHLPWGVGVTTAIVRGNTVRSNSSQSGAGISFWQWLPGQSIPNYIESNRVCGFSTAIRYKNDGSNHYYRIANNVYDGAVTRTGNTTPNVSTSANNTVASWAC